MSVTVVDALPPGANPSETSQPIPVWQIVCKDGPRFNLAWDEDNEHWVGTLTVRPGAAPLTASASGVSKLLKSLINLEEEEARPRATAEPTSKG
jgi:hypothetical protein